MVIDGQKKGVNNGKAFSLFFTGIDAFL